MRRFNKVLYWVMLPFFGVPLLYALVVGILVVALWPIWLVFTIALHWIGDGMPGGMLALIGLITLAALVGFLYWLALRKNPAVHP